MTTARPGVPLYARLGASEGDFGARGVQGGNRPSGARSANPVATAPATDTPSRGSSDSQGASQGPEVARDPRDAQRPTDGLPGLPVQLALPEALLAAMRIPDAVPSARRRGRPVHSTPDIANYQPDSFG